MVALFRARQAKQRAAIKARIAAYGKALNAWDSCVAQAGNLSCSRPPAAPVLPKLAARQPKPPGQPAKPNQPAPPPVVLSPQELAYIAFAQLTLVPPKPQIGPSPDLNQWKMAAVGYPLWLSVNGDTGPMVSTSRVYDTDVSLTASVSSVAFDMGDGHSVTCTNLHHSWSRAVQPGQASAACGYAYQRPSLPAGKYTVTARSSWSVRWQVNGQTGVIRLVQSASTQLPVGELQVLVR